MIYQWATVMGWIFQICSIFVHFFSSTDPDNHWSYSLDFKWLITILSLKPFIWISVRKQSNAIHFLSYVMVTFTITRYNVANAMFSVTSLIPVHPAPRPRHPSRAPDAASLASLPGQPPGLVPTKFTGQPTDHPSYPFMKWLSLLRLLHQPKSSKNDKKVNPKEQQINS